jgi:hypothetical protein
VKAAIEAVENRRATASPLSLLHDVNVLST